MTIPPLSLASMLAAMGLAALVQAPAHAPGPAAVWVRADRSSPARLDARTLDGSGVWTIRDGLLVLERAGVPSGPIRRPAVLAIPKSITGTARRSATPCTTGSHVQGTAVP